MQGTGNPSSDWVDQEGHTTLPALGVHEGCSPGTMEGVWPREAKGSVCPDSCCSFATWSSSVRKRKDVLGVIAEGPLLSSGAEFWHPAPPRTGISGSICPRRHRPHAHGSRCWLP